LIFPIFWLAFGLKPIENGTILAYKRTYFFKANKYGISRKSCAQLTQKHSVCYAKYHFLNVHDSQRVYDLQIIESVICL